MPVVRVARHDPLCATVTRRATLSQRMDAPLSKAADAIPARRTPARFSTNR
jgi:hypothetical protein